MKTSRRLIPGKLYRIKQRALPIFYYTVCETTRPGIEHVWGDQFVDERIGGNIEKEDILLFIETLPAREGSVSHFTWQHSPRSIFLREDRVIRIPAGYGDIYATVKLSKTSRYHGRPDHQ